MANNVVILNPSSSQGPEVAGERKKSKIEIKKLPVVGLPPSPKEAPQPKPKKQKKPKAQPTQAPQAGGLGTEGKPKKTERPEPVERQIVMQAGIVKAVNSGDSLTILEIDEENPRNNGPKEIFLTILGLKAPIVGRREVLDGKIIPDEPFAWHSREFLRKLVIGKPVVYRIEHTVEERERERSYGELWAHDETDIRMEIVSHGWADVITKPRKNSAGFDIEPTLSQMKLEAAKEEAKEKKLGIWGNSKDAIRRVRYHDLFKDENSRLSNDELYQLYKAVKDKGPLKAVVENVRNGTTFNVLLTDTFDYFTLTLSGVRSPQLKPEQQAFAREAKYFAEHLLLNRDVTVTIDGLDKLSLYGSVLLNGSNIALTLLNHGLASFVEWTSKESSALSEKFKEAEKKAQENRLRMWSDYQPLAAPEGGKGSKQESKTQATKETSVTGKVIEIINAGTITVRVAKPDANNAQKTVDRIITFSSIRLPRGPIPARAKAREEKKDLNEEEAKAKKIEEETLKRENIYAAEAKEFLRHLLIGQRVRCVFDYPRASRTNDNDKAGPVKHYWSVYLTKGQQEKNVALELVQQGYAYVVEHGQDELRSADYKDLILAEKAAKASGKNLHSPPNKVPRHFINDLTLPPSEGEMTKEQKDKALKGLLEKCRHFLVGFTSKDKIEAIVDYVFSAGRYKLTLPNNNCTIMFALTGVILDKPFKEDVQPKPDISIFDKTYPLADKNGHPIWGNIALHYVRDNAYQRKVQISVKKLDSYGAFIGQLMIDGNDLGEQLIEKGYAKIHLPSLRKAPYLAKYRTAYENARKAKIGLWEHFDFEEEAKKTQEAQDLRNSQASQKRGYPIAVTDVRSGTEFSFQELSNNDDTAALEGLSSSLQNENFAAEKPYTPKMHDIIAGQFTVDDLWYRAQVIGKSGNDFEVRYLDYGNRETLPVSRIRQLPPDYVTIIDPQAKDAKLYNLKAPALDSEFGRDSMNALREFLWDKVLYAEELRVDKPSGPKGAESKNAASIHHLIVYEEKKDLNKELIRAGHVKVDINSRFKDAYYQTLLNLQEEAHNERLGIWQYGADPEDDEDERL